MAEGEEYLDLSKFEITEELLNIIPQKIQQRYCAIPYKFDGKSVYVAMENPDDILALDNIKRDAGLKFRIITSKAKKEQIMGFFEDKTREETKGTLDDALEKIKNELGSYGGGEDTTDANTFDLGSGKGSIEEIKKTALKEIAGIEEEDEKKEKGGWFKKLKRRRR